MRSEEEIRRALNRATMECNNDEDDQVLTDAFKELLALRRRLDREALGRFIYELGAGNPIWDQETDRYQERFREFADKLKAYLLEGADGS